MDILNERTEINTVFFRLFENHRRVATYNRDNKLLSIDWYLKSTSGKEVKLCFDSQLETKYRKLSSYKDPSVYYNEEIIKVTTTYSNNKVTYKRYEKYDKYKKQHSLNWVYIGCDGVENEIKHIGDSLESEYKHLKKIIQ